MCSANRAPRARSAVNTAPARPYWVTFAMARASSSSRARIGRNGSEDFLACELHIVHHVTEDVRRQDPSGQIAANQFSRARIACIVEALHEPLELRVVDDRS